MKKLIRVNPALKIFIPFTIGVLTSGILNWNVFSIKLWMLVLAFIQAVYILLGTIIKIKDSKIRSLILCFFFYIIGWGPALYQNEGESHYFPEKIAGTFIGKIEEISTTKSGKLKILIASAKLNPQSQLLEIPAKVMVYLADTINKNELSGDLLVVKSTLFKIKNRNNPDEFDYSGYMNKKGIIYQTYPKINEFLFLNSSQLNDAEKRSIIRLRNNQINLINTAPLGNSSKALMKALVLGDKSEIEDQTRLVFSQLGILHVLAVSGLHVGIVFLLANSFFFFLNHSKWSMYLKNFLIIVILIIYAGISGMSPSVLRATLMFILLIISRVFQRRNISANILLVSAVFLLIWDPELIQNPGFQLSYGAMVGIFTFFPIVTERIKISNKFLNYIFQLFILGFSAQLGTLPFSIYYFHFYPTWSLFWNLLFIPFISVIVYFSAFSIVLLNLKIAFLPFYKITDMLIDFLFKVATYINKISGNGISWIPADKISMSLMALVILFLGLLVHQWSRKRLMSILIIGIFWCSYSISIMVHKHNQFEVLIPNDFKQQSLIFCKGTKACVILDSLSHADNIKSNYQNYFIAHGISENNIQFISFSDFPKLFGDSYYLSIQDMPTIIWLNNSISGYRTKSIIHCDYVIVNQVKGGDIDKILSFFDSDLVVMSGSCSEYWGKEFMKAADKLGRETYSIKNQGAFLKEWTVP